MKTINKLYKQVSLSFLAVMLPLISFADAGADAAKLALAEEAKAAERTNMIMEVACVVVFVGGVIAFLIWKSRQDKKIREQQMEQMKKIQATKRRAA